MKWRRPLWFAWAYVCVLLVHLLLRYQGFAGVRRWLLRPWKRRSHEIAPDDRRIRDIEWAVLHACELQLWRSECLHRAVTAYSLLRAIGARPRLLIAVRSRPFASHAWAQICNTPIADIYMDAQRARFQTLLMQIPAEELEPQMNADERR